METLTAARLQMTLSLVFHMVFAAIGIGLPLLLVLAEGRFLRTGQEHYLRMARKWSKAVALLFAVGAISGTALSFELGLLWPRFMEIAGATVGHMFALEGFAFFTEAIFIGLYLYGWDRMSARAHWWCGVVIAVSGAISGVLILGVNSWMQLPVGFAVEAGRVVVVDPIAIYKRYGWFAMSLHSTLSCYIAVAFAVAGIYAWGWLRGKRDDYHRSAMKLAMGVAAVAALAQPISGDLLAKFVFRNEPAKFAAMEGQFITQTHAPLRIGGLPDTDRGVTVGAIEIPSMLSVLAAWDPATEVRGLNDIQREHWPNVPLTHASFQIMVAIGVALAVLSIWFWVAWRRTRGGDFNRALLWCLVIGGFLGFVALEFGWVVTEVGRQPWTITPHGNYAGLLTRDAVTPAAGVHEVFWGFTALYLLLGVTVVMLLRYLAKTPLNGLDSGK